MPYAYTSSDQETDNKMASAIIMQNLSGVEGIPYQFLPSVDRRVITDPNTQNMGAIGRKYAEKIVSKIPLLFLVPCQPVFMENASKEDKSTAISALISGGLSEINEALFSDKAVGRYYTVDYAYERYYGYLNIMLTSVATFLGIQNVKIKVPGLKTRKPIGEIDWSKETNNDFKTFFSSRENLIFYLDGLDSIGESFSNSTTQSSLASTINGFSDQAKELDFLLAGGKFVDSLNTTTGQIGGEISSMLKGVSDKLGGGVVGSLISNGASSVLAGGKIVFPEIWSDSQYDKSYSLTLKLRSPDNDSVSIFLNVLKPYCKILALALPHAFKDNANAYRSPFLVKAYSKGMFNVDMGIISGISVTKGAQCAWNDDGLPTQIDISIDIVDLYKSLAISGSIDDDDMNKSGFLHWLAPLNFITTGSNLKSFVSYNTAYMDFLANMAGLNINRMELGRKYQMYYYLWKQHLTTLDSQMGTRFDQSFSKIIGKIYKWTS